MLKNLTKIQKLLLAGLVVALLTCWGIIGSLLLVLHVAEGRMQVLGDTMEAMATLHIVNDVEVHDTIPLNTDITITEELTVGIDMVVDSKIPFRAEIPVTEQMMVPIRIGVRDYLILDTTIQIKDQVTIHMNDTLPLDQKMKMPIFGKRGPNIPIKGRIPIDEDITVSFDEPMRVYSIIPIDLLIVDTLPIGLQMKIPVDLMIPIHLPIKSHAKIRFDGPMPVNAKVPLEMTIPVDIPLEETSLAEYFIKMAEGLRGMTRLSLD